MTESSVRPESGPRQDVPGLPLLLEAIGRAKPDAEAAQSKIQALLDGLRPGPAISPEALERLLNDELIAAWKVVAGYETLVAIAEAQYFRPDQIAGCLSDSRREIEGRARAVMMIRDQWKGGGYPKTGSDLVNCLILYLEPFYRAGGAEEILMGLTRAENPF